MNKIWRSVVGILAVLTLAAFARPALADAQDFSIVSFVGDYYLSRDSGNVAELKVTEKIVAQFPSIDQNHGILRAIPESYQGHSLELNIQDVKDANGKALNYSTYGENGNKVLKIGDSNTYVHGDQTYVINYTMRGVSNNLANSEEFYWDINGDQWQQPFGAVQARVHLPDYLYQNLQPNRACYIGASGTQDGRGCTVTGDNIDQNNNHMVVFTSSPQRPLQPAETMSVVLSFKSGTFANYTPSAGLIFWWVLNGLGAIVISVSALIIVVRNWRRYGKDPKGRGVIVPQYLPPKELGVLSSSQLLKERFEPKAVSATIIDLAVRHYLKIYQTKKGKMFSSTQYELELIKEPQGLRPEETDVIEMIFGPSPAVGDRVNLDDFKAKLSTKAQAAGKKVESALAQGDYFKMAPSKARLPYLIAGSITFFAGIGITFVLPLGIGLIIAGIILFIGAAIMPARTTKGVEMRDYLFGLRDYMQLAEADRLKVLQSPHGDLTEKIDVGNNKQLVKLYEKLLPYAMLFNIEKDWAKEMAPLYQQPPTWYSGYSTFNAIWFASAISGFTTTSNASFAPPTSSSGSGFAGGAAGGGGGGGGGGW